jgi:hypothetical protein
LSTFALFYRHLPNPAINRGIRDNRYALKLFFFTWAFERANAPRAYRIASVKASSDLDGSQDELPSLFGKFCGGKHNPKANPITDTRIAKFDILGVIRLIAEGSVHRAFDNLSLSGIGPKIRAFFLRDIITLLNVEPKLKNNHDNFLWCQPVDVWVRAVAQELYGARKPSFKNVPKCPLSREDRIATWHIVQLSREAGVSPLKVNQGIWYFSLNAVADMKRLQTLVRTGDETVLSNEMELMNGLIPLWPMW